MGPPDTYVSDAILVLHFGWMRDFMPQASASSKRPPKEARLGSLAGGGILHQRPARAWGGRFVHQRRNEPELNPALVEKTG
jgi:hypothetical protein